MSTGVNGSLGVVVTGAASGIGRHVAGRMIARGHRVLALDCDEQALHAAAQTWQTAAATNDGRVRLRRFDVRRADDWAEVLDEAASLWGRIDVLLNIAGIVRPTYVHRATPQDIADQMNVNALGMMYGTQAAAARMVEQGGGHIVNVASLAGIAPIPGIGLYTASKFAVRGFSLAAAMELRPLGVHVTVICPDAVRTPMLDLETHYEEAALAFSSSRPLEVEEVGRAIEHALERRPMEITLPRTRGWLAKLSSHLPALGGLLLPRLRAKGLKRQAAMRGEQAGGQGEPKA